RLPILHPKVPVYGSDSWPGGRTKIMAISGPRLLSQATALSRWLLALAIICAGLVSLTVAAHVREDAASIEHIRSAPIINVIVPPSSEGPRVADAPSPTPPSPPAFSEARFRFGFLEFEDDADAASR